MWSWGRKSSNFCDRCAEAFPDLVDDACSGRTMHAEVKRRLAEYPFCGRCFETYRRTATLCRQTLRELPESGVESLLARLREVCDA